MDPITAAALAHQIADAGYSGLRKFTEKQSTHIYQSMALEATTFVNSLIRRCETAAPDVSHRVYIERLAQLVSPASHERLVFAGMLQAALAPTIGKMRMLGALVAHLHAPAEDLDLGTLSRVAAVIPQLDPADALLLRACCFLSGRFEADRENLEQHRVFFQDEPAAIRSANTSAGWASVLLPTNDDIRFSLRRLIGLQLIQSAIVKERDQSPQVGGGPSRRSRMFKADEMLPETKYLLRNMDTHRPTRVAYAVATALFEVEPRELVDADRPQVGSD